jgi:uncharacterized protein YcaQ
MITLTNRQARQFVFLKHGLLDEYKFIGKQGALDFVRQAGCIQFDPVDTCGKNAELTLQSRVKDFTKQTLFELLYHDRKLVDYPDKNLSIIPTENWPYFERYRNAAREGGLRFEGLAGLEDQTKAYIKANGPVSADELPIQGSIRWHSSIHWSGNWGGSTNASRSVLEQLYSTGELIIHHKNGTRKYYDLAEKYIPAALLSAPEPLPDEFEHQKWRVLRRIGAVGLLWNRSSDAWLNIWGLGAQRRNDVFRALLDEGKILGINIQGFKEPLFLRSEDASLLAAVLQKDKFKPRCELIAPLDCIMWDRKLIHALFDFDYTWEIYTPAAKRKYGYYVLPLLYGENFIGRIEAAADKRTSTLTVKHIWYENGVKETKRLQAAIARCINKFAAFNECDKVGCGVPDNYGLSAK